MANVEENQKHSLDVDLSLSWQDRAFLTFRESFCAGEITALYGQSACGKSTLLNTLAGIEPGKLDVSGSIQYSGVRWLEKGFSMAACERGVGYALQDVLLFPHLSVKENMLFGDSGRSPFAFEDIITVFKIETLLPLPVQSLSGGQKQRVALARALVAASRVLIMDECLSGVDAKTRSGILSYIRKTVKSSSLIAIYVSHSLHELAEIADRVVVIENGAASAANDLIAALSFPDMPFMHLPDAEVIIEATVVKTFPDERLCQLAFEGGELLLAGTLEEQSSPRIAIKARDVSICLEKPDKTSILNILPAIVEQCLEHEDGQVSVILRVGQSRIISRISSRSCTLLELQPGKNVFAQIKGVALVNTG